jgi:MFS family permease
MGVGVAPFETIVTAWVADVFFVHERATRNSIWNMALACGSSLGAVVGGYIIQYLSWRWTFGFCAISMGVLTPALIFFVPESVYSREVEFETDLVATSADECLGDDDDGRKDKAEPDVTEGATSESPAVSTRGQPIPEPKTFAQLIAPCDGVKSEVNFFKLLLRPVKMGIYPSVIWAYLTYSCGVTWLALFGVTQAQIFSQVVSFASYP